MQLTSYAQTVEEPGWMIVDEGCSYLGQAKVDRRGLRDIHDFPI